MRLSPASIAIIVVACSVFTPLSVFAACDEPDYVPFSGGVKIVCSIDWKTGGERESAFFVPLDTDRWVAWIQGGTYTVQSVMMSATTNSCTGLALVGRKRDFLYRVFIEAESSTILANLEHENPERADEGHGHCKMLDEEFYEVEIRASDEQNPEPD